MYNLHAIAARKNFIPISPQNLKETQLDFGFLADLVLKTVYADADCSTVRAAEKLCLPVSIVESILQYLYKEKLIEVRGEISLRNHRYAMLERGLQRTQRLLDLNSYIGPAPVSLQSYTEMVLEQNQAREPVTPELVKNALSEFVLPDTTVQTLGLVAQSRRSLFMFGETGNGKSKIAMALHSVQPGEIWIPYAIEVDNQIIKVFDQHKHVQAPPDNDDEYDKRWIKIKRPLVVVGGEMTIESMDLVYSQTAKYYEAPFQVKANGGTLIIDDFGRQRIEPTALLNRWIIPLERGMDCLTLHTGKKIEVPFNQLLIFASNLDPKGLMEQAFLRRIGYRLHIAPPTPERYGSIFRRVVEAHGLDYDPKLLEFLLHCYEKEKRPLRCCEPRDIINNLLDICVYKDQPPALSSDLLELAWINYFGKPGEVIDDNPDNIATAGSVQGEAGAGTNSDSLQQINYETNPIDNVCSLPELIATPCPRKGIQTFGPLETLMEDSSVTDILIDNFNKIYVERRGKLELTNREFGSEAEYQELIDAILSNVGRRVDEWWPMEDARLPDGSRVNVIVPPLAIDGPSMSIRRFRKDAMQLEDLIKVGALNQEMGEILKGVIRARLNVLISGGTGTGKTTLLNVLSGFIPSDERIVSIEDSAELQLKQQYVVRLETRPPNPEGKGEVVQRALVKNALRMRPDRIVVGEVRGAEVLDMLQAMNTGHDGSLSTIHANSPRDALARLETLVATSGLAMPHEAVRKQIGSAINIVIQLSRLSDGSRKVVSIFEIVGMEGAMITGQEVFKFEQTGVTNQGLVQGRFISNGIRPHFFGKFSALGIEIPKF